MKKILKIIKRVVHWVLYFPLNKKTKGSARNTTKTYKKKAASRMAHANKKVTIGKGMKLSPGKESTLRKKPGGSNVGKYKKVSKGDFAGKKGGAPQGSYPINTLKRARAALAYAHNAPSPGGIKRAVYAKYPQLRKKKK